MYCKSWIEYLLTFNREALRSWDDPHIQELYVSTMVWIRNRNKLYANNSVFNSRIQPRLENYPSARLLCDNRADSEKYRTQDAMADGDPVNLTRSCVSSG